MKPKLRFPNFADDWEIQKLRDVCTYFQSGIGITSKKISKTGQFPVYGGNGVRGFTETFNHDGDYFLIGRQGALCGNIQRISGKAFVSEHAIVVQASEKNDTDWLAQRLDYFNLNRLSESSAQPGLSVSKLLKLKLPLPSLPEQRKIASFLSAVDKRIGQQRKQVELLKTYKKGVMQQIFSRQIRFKDEEGKDFPEWEEKKLGEVLQAFKKKSTIENEFQVLTSSRTGLVKQEDYFGGGRVLEKSNIGFNILPPGHLTYRSRSDNRSFIFNFYSGERNSIVSSYYPVFKASNGVSIFFSYYLNFSTTEIGKFAVGTSQTVLSFNQLKSIKLFIPTKLEQQKIASFLSALDQKIDQAHAKLERLEAFKKGLLQGMFV